MASNEWLQAELARLRQDCPDILGALLATPEGLFMAGAGTLGGDPAAAASSYLADLLDGSMAMLASSPCREAVIWNASGVWGLARMPSRHVLLAQASAQCSAGNVRLALVRLRNDIGARL